MKQLFISYNGAAEWARLHLRKGLAYRIEPAYVRNRDGSADFGYVIRHDK